MHEVVLVSEVVLASREVAMLLFVEEALLAGVTRFRGLYPFSISTGVRAFLFRIGSWFFLVGVCGLSNGVEMVEGAMTTTMMGDG